MKLSWQRWAAGVAVGAMFLAGAMLQDDLPQRVASHWSVDGRADGYTSPFWGAFGLPLISSVILLVLILAPLIDPMRANIKKFIKSYDNFLLAFVLFFAYLYGLSLVFNLRGPFHFGQWIVPGLSALFWVMGSVIAKAEYNYTIGIRTPWTLADKKVWRQTHRLGGDIFRLAAVFMLAGLAFADQIFWFVIGLTLFATGYSVGYSYYLYRRLHR